jgi:uncharacterized RDD family membrane protein YckC
MLSPLDLSPLFFGRPRSSDDYPLWRAKYMGTLDPIDFLISVVDNKAQHPVEEDALGHDGREGVNGGGAATTDKEVIGLFEEVRGFISGEGEARVIDAEVLTFLDVYRRAYQVVKTPREKSQLSFSYRVLGGLELGQLDDYQLGGSAGSGDTEGAIPDILGVILESRTPNEEGAASSRLLVYVGMDGHSSAMWEDGAVRGHGYDRSLKELGLEVIRLAKTSVRLGHLAEAAEPMELVGEGRVLFTVVTPAGFYTARLREASVESSPLADLFKSMGRVYYSLCSSPVLEGVSSVESVGGNPVVPVGDFGSLFLRRWLAFSVDGACFTFFAALLLWGFLPGHGRPGSFTALLTTFLADPVKSMMVFLMDSTQGVGLSVSLLVFPLVLMGFPLVSSLCESSEALGYATLGKKLFSLSVVSLTPNDRKVGFLQALARNFAKWYLSPLFLCTGYFWGLFHSQGRCWHDIFALTAVSLKGGHKES